MQTITLTPEAAQTVLEYAEARCIFGSKNANEALDSIMEDANKKTIVFKISELPTVGELYGESIICLESYKNAKGYKILGMGFCLENLSIVCLEKQ